MIHFFDPSNERVTAKLAALALTTDILLGNLEDAIAADRKEVPRARSASSRSGARSTSARPRCGRGSTRSTRRGPWTTSCAWSARSATGWRL